MDAVVVAKALADHTRFRLLMALRRGERCVCQLVTLVGLANATVSKHLLALRTAGLVESRKEGRWMYYRLARDPHPTVRAALKWACAAWAQSPQEKVDDQALTEICCRDPEELCQILRKKDR
jgi:DNA-binding transcriptional ArsR family regulator